MSSLSLHSPLGPLTVTEADGAIVSLDWGWRARQGEAENGLLGLARDQLMEYFDGARTGFALPLSPAGTPFQRRVWRQMMAIPYGATQSYGEMAALCGGGARAVGTACGRNPIPVIIPCHRVVATGGRIGGYSGGGGPATKNFLLTLESGEARMFG
ncbi:MAG: methylated-DNA--[protein]-cysteine S-methyltransferase [Alphaproteobacteria bacterium]|nr:methylated-DNA--[protein]-cysteine S-methyltransferase [Alphaproteobacteria bacterium]